MTWVLVRKLLRDIRVPLLVVALLLTAFLCLWAKVTERVLGELAPFFNGVAALGGFGQRDIEHIVFNGPGKIMRTVIGGDNIRTDRAMDMISIAYVHPLVQTIFCIWAVGRASGAIAGEIDRGTMELLLSQPLARTRVLLAHLWVDVLSIPLLCLSVWVGTCVGAWLITPIEVRFPEDPRFALLRTLPMDPSKLEIHPLRFLTAIPVMAGLIFAVSGFTMALSAAGRFRWRVLGLAVFLVLLQFLVNLIGQMWEFASPLRPLTIFYYYQPQQAILNNHWLVDFSVWNGGKPLVEVPMVLVLFTIGAVGYLAAWITFVRRDLPAPL